MPVAVLFDTLEYVRKLERAGVPAQQAEAQAQALAGALGDAVATRNDLQATETKLETAILAVKHDLETKIDKLASAVDMIKWLFGFLAASNIAIFVRLAMQS